VVTARNDNHGGDLLRRAQIFVDGIVEQCRRHGLSAELIVVEWNPPPDKPRLAEALSWSEGGGPCRVRIIEVPAEIHHRFEHANALPLFQMIAKNVGLRRARGRFVLATNIDLLFSSELIRFLASGRLQYNSMYRVNRHDVPADVPEHACVEDQLEYCRTHVLRVSDRWGTRNLITGRYYRAYKRPRWLTWPLERLQDHRLLPVVTQVRLHTNACGDFTLMARERWHALRGYPELNMFSLHLDSLLCHAAYHSGVREEVLGDPMRIYHLEHALGSGWTPEGQQELNMRLGQAGVPRLADDQLGSWARQMRRQRKPMMLNPENWGLRDDDLHETTVWWGFDD
jgi:hypothetical protein